MMRGDVNAGAWSTMTITGYVQSDDDTVTIISAVHESKELASVGSTHAPITSVPSTVTFIATLLIMYACLTISGLAPIGATTSDLHVTLLAETQHYAHLTRFTSVSRLTSTLLVQDAVL